ncbi:thiamine phosphate synthase [Corynebacterium hylobatis]|uniref:Thiamine-phosphate synthase n=1 Tax=Corynebacterium hylobatis TaxID=1859290 RepID=A0A3S0AVH2_9CORY|nr:thiamine phosphate synthase [Corynebacterium hylobatis]RSZ62047.1 thiamine phosphate synthase [Corynebacterium hylobatis]
MPSIDLRCYLVTGAGSREHVVDVARAAVAGGSRIVQVRSKPISARDLYALTEQVALAVGDRAHVLVDDRVDVALALRHRGIPVHGVHVGQDDLAVRDVRALLGADAVIGLTTGTRELVAAANELADVLDYVGAGPFRPTPTKDSGREPVGLAGYRELVELSKVPVVAIGDVTADDAAELAGTGVAGLAVVRSLMSAADPAAYAQRLIRDFEQGRP